MLPMMMMVLALASFLLVGASEAQQQQHQQQQQHPVIEWLQSAEIGGYFSDKVKFDQGGMFAQQDIAKGQVVMMIPPAALLGPLGFDDEDADDDYDDIDECATARRLVYEYATLGPTKSKYWPYVQYVFESFPHRTVPLGWSIEGKQLVRDMVGTSLDPQRFGQGSYAEACEDDDDDDSDEEEDDDKKKKKKQLLEAAWRIVISRGWHHIMVPVYDMVNHRNGNMVGHNVDRDPNKNGDTDTAANLEVDGDFSIVALKDIAAGAQLHNSYNQCHDVTCFGIDKSYVTPNIFADYGFVEPTPRRFAFDTGHDPDEELGLVFEIDDNHAEHDADKTSSSNKNDETNGDVVVRWLNREGSPNPGQMEWMEQQWKRLTDDTFAQDIAQRAEQLTAKSERNASLEYYQAMTSALEHALQSARRGRNRREDGGDGDPKEEDENGGGGTTDEF